MGLFDLPKGNLNILGPGSFENKSSTPAVKKAVYDSAKAAGKDDQTAELIASDYSGSGGAGIFQAPSLYNTTVKELNSILKPVTNAISGAYKKFSDNYNEHGYYQLPGAVGKVQSKIAEFIGPESVNSRIQKKLAQGVSEEDAKKEAEREYMNEEVGNMVMGMSGGMKIIGNISKRSLAKIAATTSAEEIKKILGKEAKDLGGDMIEKLSQKLTKTSDVTKVESIVANAFKKVPVDLTKYQIKDIARKATEQKFREDKLNLPAKVAQGIKDRLAVLGLDTREIVSFKEMQQAAQELGTDVETLLKTSQKNLLNRDEAVALKNLINTNSQFITNAQKTLSEVADDALQSKVDIAQAQIDRALQKLIKGGTEAGRTVASFRILANKSMEPAFWYAQAKKLLDETPFTLDMKNAIDDLIAKNDRIGLATFTSMLRQPSKVDKAVSLWKAGLLTSPTTHLANVMGNITMAGLETVKDLIATPLDYLISLGTKQRTTTISPRTVFNKVKGFSEAGGKAWDYMKTGVYSDELLAKYDLPRQTNFKNKILDVYTKSIFRSLGAEDIFFRQAALQESLAKQAEVMAKNEGFKGAEYVARVKQLLQEPTEKMAQEAIDAAEYATFQSKNMLASMVGGMKRAAQSGIGKTKAGKIGAETAKAALEVAAPFVRTPTNVAARILDYSPAGFIKAIVQGVEGKGQKALVDNISRATTGTGIIALGSYLASKGLITGNAPTNAKERDMWYAEGKQPMSIKVGDQWLRISRLSPLGNLLALGAEVNNLKDQGKKGVDLIGSAAASGVKTLSEQTFLKGVSGMLSAINDPGTYTEKFINDTVGSLVPAVLNRFTRTIDPNMRIPEGVLENIMNRLPVLSEKVAPRRDIFGEKVESGGGRLSLVDPFSSKEAVDDPIINEAKDLGTTIGLPSQTISGIKLDNHEYSTYQKVQGKILKQYLIQLIQSPGYQALDKVEREKVFNSAVTDVREQINDTVFPALMVKRYNLPAETNPQILRELLLQLSKSKEFKDSSTDDQAKVIKNLLAGIGSK